MRSWYSGRFAEVKDIELTDTGLLGKSVAIGAEYIRSIDMDRLLAPCYEVHGLTAPNGAERYGGWERKGADNWTPGGGSDTYTLAGHSLGHWMSAASMFYAQCGDDRIRNMLYYVVNSLDELQRKTGSAYIGGCCEDTFIKMFSGDENWACGYWVPWYGIHKIYQGLIDAYYYAGSNTALEVVKRFSDWAANGIKDLTDDFIQRALGVEYGGMNEVFAEMYAITGDKRYLETARRFTHDEILNPLIKGCDCLTGLHANTQIPKIVGAAAIYEQDPDMYHAYREGCKNFWKFVVNERSYVIGGNSISEHFEAKGAETLGIKTCESCNSYNMLKLAEHLYRWDHDVKYMDHYERILYNHILGQQDPDTGSKMYFVSLLQGHHRIYEEKGKAWWCCTGTGMENPGRYTRAVYYIDGDSLYVNLYMSTVYRWHEKGLKVSIETEYPYSENVVFTVMEGTAEATVMFRAPEWVKGEAKAIVCGKTYTAKPGKYIKIRRIWEAGDTVNVTIPMGINVYYSRTNGQIAYEYGPVVLAAEIDPLSCGGCYAAGVNEYVVNETVLDSVTQSVPFIITNSKDPGVLVKKVGNKGLLFKIDAENSSDGNEIFLKPFYEIHHHFYNVYWDLDKAAGEYEKTLNNVTIDKVQPDGQQDEIGHMLREKNSHNGSFTYGSSTYFRRDAWGSDGAYFGYTMNVNDTAKYLFVRYWGDDKSFTDNGIEYTRDFNIRIDGVLIAEQKLNGGAIGEIDIFYEIPHELIVGKTAVNVGFSVKDERTCAGGVLEVRVTANRVDINATNRSNQKE